MTVGVRTGDTSGYFRGRNSAKNPPHLLITTPESLSLLLSQKAWAPIWKTVEHLIVDEIHALVPTKRGADLAVSLERLAALGRSRPGAGRPVGDLPAAGAGGTVPRRAGPAVPGDRGAEARRQGGAGDRGRVAPGARTRRRTGA